MVGKKPKKSIVMCNEISYMTKEQLKSELKKRELKTSGSRNELLLRLGAAMATIKRKGDIVTYSNGEQSNNTTIKNNKESAQKKQDEREARERIVLWLQPVITLTYFSKQLTDIVAQAVMRLMYHKMLVTALSISALLFTMVLHLDGPHQAFVIVARKQVVWCLYWLGLGILSSVGLGTGLHTFVLYLGPHIASVTLAAYECNSLSFPEPPYPDEIICPEGDIPLAGVSIWQIMSKVRLEAMMWGAGTALGELPPYFMARAARLSGCDPDDEDDLREFEELQLKKNNQTELTIVDRAKIYVEKMVEKVGFLAILGCASIPNPLFDLAGITCGHFLVPFWTFFGATLLGKAVIKMHVQKMFVIIAFNESLLKQAVSSMALVPYFGQKLQSPLKEFLEKQKQKLHRTVAAEASEGGHFIGWVFEKLVMIMVFYFIVSIINSLAQSYHKRLCKQKSKHPKYAKD